MRFRICKHILMMSILGLVACASKPKGMYVTENSQALKDDEALVLICWPEKDVGGQFNLEVLVDGNSAAELHVGSILEIVVPRRTTNIRLRREPPLKGPELHLRADTTAEVKKFFTIGVVTTSGFVLPTPWGIVASSRGHWSTASVSESKLDELCSNVPRLRVRPRRS